MLSQIKIIYFMYPAEKFCFTFVEPGEKNVFMGETLLVMHQDQLKNIFFHILSFTGEPCSLVN